MTKSKKLIIAGIALFIVDFIFDVVDISRIESGFLSLLVNLIYELSFIVGGALIIWGITILDTSKHAWRVLTIAIWSVLIVGISLTIYVNYALPHGPSYPTGEWICKNDDRGPCHEEYVEDLTNVQIPDWAKFVRQDARWSLLGFGMFFLGIVAAHSKNKELSY